MRFVPHKYQQNVINHILSHHGTGVFLDMGLGKTAITLMAILIEIYDLLEVDKVLIIAPKKVAEATWQDEAGKWEDFKGLRISTVLGAKKQRIRALAAEADIYIINRENTEWLIRYYNGKLPFTMLVVDESTSFKDPKTRRWRALKKVRTCFSKVIILTGTPRPNSLMDLWAQIYLLDGGDRLGKTITEYRNNYFIPDKQNGPIVYSYRIRNEEAEREVYDRIKDICISMKASDYLELPERLPPVEVPVVLDAKAWGVYKKMEKDCVLELQGKEITATAAAAVSNKLLQMANGAVYDDEKNVVEVHRAKLAALREIIDAASGPVLVFYNFRHDLARILEEFKEARELKNAEDIRAWNAGHIKMLLAHPASAGYGLNLQAGGHIIVWYGLTWSLEQYLQANARLDRQGQKEPVIIHHLIAKGTMDEAVMRALATKKKGQDAMMAAVGELVRGGENGGR